jgi:hypothetical protein
MLANTIHDFGGGRLGNQLFKWSFLYSIKLKTGKDFYISKNDGIHCHQFWNCFDMDIKTEGYTNYNKSYGCPYEYYESVYTENIGTKYDGYFQNIMYIQDIKNEIIKEVKFKKEHNEYATDYIKNIKQKYNSSICSIHIRRGDYVQDQRVENILGNLTKSNYYNHAIIDINEPVYYLIFSDDVEWCKNNFKNLNAEIIVADEYKSLCLMTKTDYNIIANSTFSWWGAFLNPNSIVYAPSKWTGPKDNSSCKYQQNFIINNWKTIEVQY